MTSPYAFFQFWLNAEDAVVGNLLRVFTFRSRAEIEILEESARERPHLREAQRALAQDVTTLVHGAAAAQRVEAAARALFGRDGAELSGLDATTLRDATAELPQTSAQIGDRLVDLFASTGLVAGRNAARRAVAEGGAYLNNTKVSDVEAVLSAGDLLPGGVALLRRGRRSLAAVNVPQD
jgi:tyrosyl-tRNA synthetase